MYAKIYSFLWCDKDQTIWKVKECSTWAFRQKTLTKGLKFWRNTSAAAEWQKQTSKKETMRGLEIKLCPQHLKKWKSRDHTQGKMITCNYRMTLFTRSVPEGSFFFVLLRHNVDQLFSCLPSGTASDPFPASPSLLKGPRCCGTHRWSSLTWRCWLRAPTPPH